MITIATSERPPRAKFNKYHIALCIMVNLVFSCWVSKHDLILDVLDEKNELNKLTNSQFKAYSWRSWHPVTASDKKASLFSCHSVVGLSTWEKKKLSLYVFKVISRYILGHSFTRLQKMIRTNLEYIQEAQLKLVVKFFNFSPRLDVKHSPYSGKWCHNTRIL